MNDKQWQELLDVIGGKVLEPLPVGFIIDSPWIPNWAGMTIKEYFDDDEKWCDANLKAVERFPDVMFLPGFWSEFGMCTEPSAFGCKCIWHENELPFAEKVITDIGQVSDLAIPDPSKEGLCPRVIERLKVNEGRISESGHAVRFAVSRGPLNLASFLMGNTEFLMAMYTDPEECHKLLNIVTEFIVKWVRLQKESFESIDGIFILDDIVGFIGEDDFLEYAKPYLTRIYSAFGAKVKFFHNDAPGKVCAPHLSDIGINLFNFAFDHSLQEMKEWTGNKVTLLGNIPPRDVLARGTLEDVKKAVQSALDSVEDKTRIIFSCGGGMPPDVTTEKIDVFLNAARA